MTDGEQDPGTDAKVHEVEAAGRRYREASPENREAAWLELWHARDFTWKGRSAKAALQTEMVEVPASFPDGREAEGEFKTVTLQNYWRWSIGLPGEERLLTDEEIRQAGLLVDVDGETYHLIHAPDMGLKSDQHDNPLQILKDIVAARAKRVLEDIGTDADEYTNFARALQLQGGWLAGELSQYFCTATAIDMSGARIANINLKGLKVGHLNCVKVLFTGEANFRNATFSGMANFGFATFSSEARFVGATFKQRVAFRGAFFRYAAFSSTDFGNVASFDSATFGSRADFQSAKFAGRAYFSKTRFLPDVVEINYRNVIFAAGASFHEVAFSVLAEFDRASFGGDAGFAKTIFQEDASYKSATFSGKATFEQAAFQGGVSFEKATFERESSFEGVDWPDHSIDNAFKSTRFKDRADFSSHRLEPVSAFNETRFDIEPIFSDPKQRSIADVFTASMWQTIKSIRDDRKGKREAGPSPDDRLGALEGGFRTLKNIAERKGDFLLYQAYYRFEVRTRVKRPRIAFWEKVAATLYGLSSDYGNSIARPLFSLIFTLVSFAAIYLALAIEVNLVDWQDRAALQSGFFESIDFSLKNVFRPLSALSTDAPREGDASSLAEKLLNNYGKAFGLIVTAISIVQSVTAIVLAFLIGLAVRRSLDIS
jgi:uncharacterized protein YjbI with pentapeptide repeats